MKGVATLYRWSVPEGEEVQLVRQWRTAARELRRRGALGCLLMRAESGELVGFIRWSSEYARSEGLKDAETHVGGGTMRWEAKLTIEDAATGGPTVPLGLAL